ncbi:hypothetical protein N7448_008794 [Penicillium atrosanguineum]|uniref:Uncharacterized protein n=1 Tax=Penicillium atrosanguineum TaxID=1132637 RepID=A0A9W9GS41_9EURO|nr:Isopentenyl-diphosphate delta-isomerase type 1 [Penicillium atrosanguineum]KAJ5128015.1 hypothetical protein N7448_008794 [Penicillium atrosanguineum]KAJ5148227.1 hypothetical protein N7526_001579 [Penicillium atrosanguineum]KAJ5313294.1 Isopentenyl-diphosphate delta-isomerase type 1 [Penicillium atrosanguineum]KAJ5330390.1 hypothetical protein N7476_000173 [Penicillium atrosanguineum]
MIRNKDRLYVALYARRGKSETSGKKDAYHWGLVIGPKTEKNPSKSGIRFDAIEKLTTKGPVWQLVEETTSLLPGTTMVLIRVMIGKIIDKERLLSVLRNTPVPAYEPRPAHDIYNCFTWVEETLGSIQRDGKAMGSSVLDWDSVRETALWYVKYHVAKMKLDRRTERDGGYNINTVASWDLIAGKEFPT